jgi:hypothetical protein
MIQEKIYTISHQNFFVRDVPVPSPLTPEEKDQGKYKILEKYFDDLYKLFVHKLGDFDCAPSVNSETKKKLKSLLNELIHIKELLADTI